MAVEALPSVAKIVELRLAIDVPADDVRRPLTLKAPYSAPLRDLWSGEMLLAAMLPAVTRRVAAFLEALDGRVTPFKVLLSAGTFSQPCAHTAALQAVPAYGAGTLSLSMTPTTGTLLAGTLLTVGDIETDTYQLFEVTEDTTVTATTAVPVAPRVRQLFSLSDPVVLGSVYGKFRLSEDRLDASVLISSGSVVVKMIEAL